MTGQAERLRTRTQALLASKAALLYPHTGTFSRTGRVQYGLRDLSSENAGRNAVRLVTDPLPASLRVLSVLPGLPRPEPGESAPHGAAQLHVGDWTDTHPLTGIAFAVCRLVDARAYPTAATTASGAAFRLRVKALDGDALSVGGDNDLRATPGNSHRAFLPPGVQLQPGETVTTADGDRYLVIPPVQRDALGDTVGLSWQGSGRAAPREPLPAPGSPDPTPSAPAPAPTPNGSYDPWWDEETP